MDIDEHTAEEYRDKEKKFYFGDRVITPTGEEGAVTELDRNEYRVDGSLPLGWYTADELTKKI